MSGGWWSERPDPERGREILDGIDRFKRRLAAEVGEGIHLVAAAPELGPAGPGWICFVCGNTLSGTHTPKPTKRGYAHPSCDKRWSRMSVPEQNALLVTRAMAVRR